MDRGRSLRLLASLCDQSLSSLTGFVVLFTALRELRIEDLGIFTLLYTSAFAVITLVRPLSLEPFSVRFAAGPLATRDSEAAKALGCSLAIGALLVPVAVVAGFLAPALKVPLLATALALIPLLVQDGWRFYLLASGRAWSATLNDGVCLVATLSGVLAARAIVDFTPTVLIGLWGLGTLAGASIGILQAQFLPKPRAAIDWLRSVKGLGLRFAAEVTIDRLGAQVALLLIGVIAGARALGQIAAARTIMSPMITVVSSIALFAVPEAARIKAQQDNSVLLRFLALASIGLGLSIALFTAGVLVLPESLGKSIIGTNWGSARSLLVPVSAWTVAAALRYSPKVGLQAQECSVELLRIVTLTAPTTILLTALGGYIAGAAGASWGFAFSNLVSVTLLWGTLLRVSGIRRANIIAGT